ncbi:MAG: glycosyltransferase family 4 protein [Chromatiales bacterium]|nr:glycosyltransferase family 4 protein [Chromatiales bacterium]
MSGSPPTPPGILFALPWPIAAIGGVNQVVLNLMRQARQTGAARPLLLEYAGEDEQAHTPIAGDPAPVIRLRVPMPCAAPQPFRSTLSFLLRLPRTLQSLRTVLRENGVALVNVHYPTLAALHFGILRALRGYRGKLALSFHGVDIRNATQTRGLERLAWRWLMRSADGIVACSEALGTEVLGFDPECRQRLKVIHNGIDPDVLVATQPGSPPPARPCSQDYLLSVGTFEQKKGQDVLLEAFRRLAPLHPDLHLLLVGRSTAWLAGLRELAVRHGLEKRVHFHPDVPHEDIARFFAHARAFCLPSRSEPFGIVVLEAGVFGLPVVASAVGGVTEILRPGVDGTLVPPDDPEALCVALHEALRPGDAVRYQAASLKARVLRDFTWRSAFARYLELI